MKKPVCEAAHVVDQVRFLSRLKISATAVLFVAAAIVLAMSVSNTATAQSSYAPDLQPNPEYQPDEVVGIQMRALANNDRPFADAGIEVTFRFASPRNKVSTGPIERFTTLFEHPAYRSMLDHSALEVGEAEIRSDQARVPVTVESNSGKSIVYLFSLSLQSEAPYLNCWMTDSVTPIAVSNSEAPVIM